MEFSIKSVSAEKAKSACLIAFVLGKRKLSNTAVAIDSASKKYISSLIKKGDIEGNADETLLIHNVPKINAERVLLIGIGKKSELSEAKYIKACKSAFSAIKAKRLKSVVFPIDDYEINKSFAWKVKQAILACNEIFYNFDSFKSKQNKNGNILKQVIFTTESKGDKDLGSEAIVESLATAKGINLTKDLANTPANICNPEYLANKAKELAKQYKKFKTSVLNKKQLEEHGMGAILAVGQGSSSEPKLITMEYKGGSTNEKPIVFVGKGITFDTGGHSLKPAQSMVGMKFDMTGAATVLGMMVFAAELELPLNIVGVIASAENMPGSTAYRPDDVITSMSGTTIEVLNTDAEGRLVLCDALTYVEKYDPEFVIDIATLTGACIVALGKHHSGLFGNSEELINDLLKSGKNSMDRCWNLPIGPDYKEQLKSNIADLANIGGMDAGSITAACFLSHFTEKYNWAHLDIAGTGMGGSFPVKNGSASGRPVPMLSEYLLNRC